MNIELEKFSCREVGGGDDEEERSRGSIHRVVNATSVAVSLPFNPYGCALRSIFSSTLRYQPHAVEVAGEVGSGTDVEVVGGRADGVGDNKQIAEITRVTTACVS